MSLEDAMNNLAKAMNRYADVIEKHGVSVVSKANGSGGEEEESGGKPTTTSKATKSTTSKASGKASNKGADKDEGDDDGLGGGDGGKATGKGKAKKALTFDEVKAKLLEVKELGGREAAAEIFGEYGYSSLNNVQEKDYQSIFDDAVKYLDDNAE